jgi:hypothetical protein
MGRVSSAANRGISLARIRAVRILLGRGPTARRKNYSSSQSYWVNELPACNERVGGCIVPTRREGKKDEQFHFTSVDMSWTRPPLLPNS